MLHKKPVTAQGHGKRPSSKVSGWYSALESQGRRLLLDESSLGSFPTFQPVIAEGPYEPGMASWYLVTPGGAAFPAAPGYVCSPIPFQSLYEPFVNTGRFIRKNCKGLVSDPGCFDP